MSRAREETRKYVSQARGRAATLVRVGRHNARKMGRDFTLDPEFVLEQVQHGFCQVTGIPFDLQPASASRRNPWAPSLDRVDGSKGYVPGNVRVVVWAFNNARGQWADDVLLRLARAIVGATEKGRL